MMIWTLNIRRRKDVPDSEEDGNPQQSIVLCLLTVDLCIGATRSREAAGMKRSKATVKDGRANNGQMNISETKFSPCHP
ncbi:hypothetical protein STEG23_030078 [Scotinomys teguina]